VKQTDWAKVGFAVATGVALATPTTAQQSDGAGGLAAVLSFGQEFRFSDNLNFGVGEISGMQALTTLGLEVSNITRRSELRFNVDGRFEAGRDAQSGFINPAFGLSYKTTGSRNTALSFNARYRESDVSDLVLDPTIPGGLILGEGTAANSSARVAWETGIQARFGVGLDAQYSARDFSGTTDPDFFDTEQWIYGITARFDVTRTATLRLRYEETDYEALDVLRTRRDRKVLSLAGTFELRPDLTLEAAISHEDNVTNTLVGTTVYNGLGYRLASIRELTNGSLTAEIESSVLSNGRETRASVERALDLRDGSLSFSFGVLRPPRQKSQPLLNIDYLKELPRGEFRVGLSQSTSIDAEQRTVLNSQLNANYSQTINSVSNWSAGLGFVDSNVLGFDEDTSRIDLTVSYDRELTRDWDLVAGYTYSKAEDDTTADRSSNTLFVRLQRDFEFRP